MATPIETFVTKTRLSVIDNLESANRLYDIVSHLSKIANSIGDENNQPANEIRAQALKIFGEAEKVSKQARILGTELSNLVLN